MWASFRYFMMRSTPAPVRRACGSIRRAGDGMNADERAFQAIFPILRRIRIGRLHVDLEMQLAGFLGAPGDWFQQLFEVLELRVLDQDFTQIKHVKPFSRFSPAPPLPHQRE